MNSKIMAMSEEEFMSRASRLTKAIDNGLTGSDMLTLRTGVEFSDPVKATIRARSGRFNGPRWLCNLRAWVSVHAQLAFR